MPSEARRLLLREEVELPDYWEDDRLHGRQLPLDHVVPLRQQPRSLGRSARVAGEAELDEEVFVDRGRGGGPRDRRHVHAMRLQRQVLDVDVLDAVASWAARGDGIYRQLAHAALLLLQRASARIARRHVWKMSPTQKRARLAGCACGTRGFEEATTRTLLNVM